MSYYEPKFMIFVMLFVSALCSLNFPVLGLVMAKFMFAMMDDPQGDAYLKNRNFWAAIWVIDVVFIGIVTFAQKYVFGKTGDRLTYNMRRELFRGILYKQVAWFDSETRAPGVLTCILSEDIMALNGMTTETVALMMQVILSLLMGVLISAFFCWQQVAVTMLCSPLLVIGAVGLNRLQWGRKSEDNSEKVDVYLKANALMSDSSVLKIDLTFMISIFVRLQLWTVPLATETMDATVDGWTMPSSTLWTMALRLRPTAL